MQARYPKHIVLLVEDLVGPLRDAAALESDPFAIESAIREDLKLARSGELVVRFPSSDRSNPRFP